jgi:hypothetical protein
MSTTSGGDQDLAGCDSSPDLRAEQKRADDPGRWTAAVAFAAGQQIEVAGAVVADHKANIAFVKLNGREWRRWNQFKTAGKRFGTPGGARRHKERKWDPLKRHFDFSSAR